MDSYTITIAPNDDSGAATRLVVETSSDQVRITDVHLHAPQGLSSGHIPSVDFDLLLQAVTGTGTASTGQSAAATTALNAPHDTPALEAGTTAEPVKQPITPSTPAGRARKSARRAATTPTPRHARARTPKGAPRETTTAPQRATRTAKQTPAKTTGKTVTAKTLSAPETSKRAKAPAKRQTPAKRTRTAKTTAGPASGGGRVYRRTPDDLAAIFEQVGTVAGVAAHYEVPRYTAQGWVGRLRATS